MVCDHFWDEDKNTRCNGRFCANCSNRHYGTKLSELENLDNWICFKCVNVCVCAACRRTRNPQLSQVKENPSTKKNTSKKRSKEDIYVDKAYNKKIQIDPKNFENVKRETRLQKNLKQIDENQKSPVNNPPSQTNHLNNVFHKKDSNNAFDLLLEASMHYLEPVPKKPEMRNNKGDLRHLLNHDQPIDYAPKREMAILPTPGNPAQVSQLKLEVENLTSEIFQMRNEFKNLQKLFHYHLKDKICFQN